MGASASQPWHHPTSKAPNQPATAPVPVPFLPHPHPSPCLVLRRAAHVVDRGGGGRKSSRIAKSPPTHLSEQSTQAASSQKCMHDATCTQARHVCSARRVSSTPFTTHHHHASPTQPQTRPACCGRTSQCPPPPLRPIIPLSPPLYPCPGVAWLHPAVGLVCRGPAWGSVFLALLLLLMFACYLLGPVVPRPRPARGVVRARRGTPEHSRMPVPGHDAVGTTCYLGAFPSSPSRPSLSFEHDPNLYIFHLCRGFAQTFVLRPPILGVVPLEVLR